MIVADDRKVEVRITMEYRGEVHTTYERGRPVKEVVFDDSDFEKGVRYLASELAAAAAKEM